MMNSADGRRRWLGMLFLVLAAGMLLWGQTVLKDRLAGLDYLVYWTFCFVFTMSAILVALIDIRVLRKRTRQEHRNLLEHTLDEVERRSDEKGRTKNKEGGQC